MAITHIGTNTQDSAGALALTFTLPTHTTDDLLLAFVKQSENTGQQTWDDDGGGGNGWTRLAYNRTTGGRDMETAIYYKVATSASETNPTFTWNTTGTTEPMSGTVEVYRGVDTTTPIQTFAYANAQNDANPPNPNVSIDNDGSTIVVFHGATHDDITTTAAPTGFTMRGEVWNGAADDHRNIFAADKINHTGTGSYTPPDWGHSVLNTTPEYHTYTLVLQEPIVTAVTDFNTTEQFNWGDTNLVITGFGFEATQGTGKVEFWDDVSGTTKTTQTIDTWADTSIQIDTVQGSLPNNAVVYLVVTNDSADVTATFAVTVGLVPYTDVILNLKPDHFWKLDNTYDDDGITGPVRDMTSGVVGTHVFSTTTLVEDTTRSLAFSSVTDRREIADSENMNITISSQERTIMAWIQLGGIQQSLGAIWKEGGGVQNLAFIVGIGNVLTAQLADTAGTRDNVQAFSDFRLEAGRTYFILMQYTHVETTKEFRLFIDGIKQTVTDGNPMTLGIFDSHSGDVTWNAPDNNLETGGTDIAYAGMDDILESHWATWSDNSTNTTAGYLSQSEITTLFERGAKPTTTISTGTESAMQTSLDALADSTRVNAPLAIRIEPVTGGGDFELTADNINFNSSITLELQYTGSDTLTWVNSNGGTVDTNKFSTPGGGTITVVEDVPVTATVQDINTKTAVQNARVLIEADTGGDLPAAESVTITRSGSTATVAHTAHGAPDGSQVVVRGSNQDEYNGIFTITVTGVNSYTYTVSGTPTTPATGTITATSVIVNGTTDVSGEITANLRYTSNQPITGKARKATGGTLYKTTPISGTITSTGLSLEVFLIGDE